MEHIRKTLNVFDEMGKYWAEIADQNQTERQISFIKSILKPKGLVLDLACGTGRHLIALGKECYHVVGLDVSTKLLSIAKGRENNAEVIRADMRFLPFKSNAFSAIMSMDTSFGYLPTIQDDLQSLKELHSTLPRGGILTVDVFNREHQIKLHETKDQPRRREYPSFFLFQKRTVTQDGGELHYEWTIRDKKDGQFRVFEHAVRLYRLEELRDLLENAGFNVNSVYGDYEFQEFSSDSNRLIVVAMAK